MRSLMPALLLAALLGGALPAPSKTPSQSAYPDSRLLVYDALFFRVTWLEGQANKLASQGKSGAFMRSAIRQQAGLTTQEEASLKAIAADWRGKESAIETASKALIAAGARGPTSAPLQNLAQQRKQMIADHINQLQAALGPARFAVLDGYATSTANVQARRPPAK